jgi:alpha-beta hydrolase superfamily lysophospholipase
MKHPPEYPDVSRQSVNPPQRDTLPQNATLSAPQRTAMDAMLLGKSVTAAAQEADIDRGTLHRWLKHDPLFRATYNARRADLVESAQMRLLATVESATATIERAIANGNVPTALIVLKSLGLLSPVTVGSDDIEHIRKQQRLSRLALANSLAERESFLREQMDADNG